MAFEAYDFIPDPFYRVYRSYTGSMSPVFESNCFQGTTCPWKIGVDGAPSGIEMMYNYYHAHPRKATTRITMISHYYNIDAGVTRGLNPPKLEVETARYGIETIELLDKNMLVSAQLLALMKLASLKLPSVRATNSTSSGMSGAISLWIKPQQANFQNLLHNIYICTWDLYFAPFLSDKHVANRRVSVVSKRIDSYGNCPKLDLSYMGSGLFGRLFNTYTDTILKDMFTRRLVEYVQHPSEDTLIYGNYVNSYFKSIYNLFEILYNSFYKDTNLAKYIESMRKDVDKTTMYDDYMETILPHVCNDCIPAISKCVSHYKNTGEWRKPLCGQLNRLGQDIHTNLMLSGADGRHEQPVPKHVQEEVMSRVLANPYSWYLWNMKAISKAITVNGYYRHNRIKFKVKEETISGNEKKEEETL